MTALLTSPAKRTCDSSCTEQNQKFGPGFSELSIQAKCKQVALIGTANISVALNKTYGVQSDSGFGILMYHRVCAPVKNVPVPTMNVSADQFRRQLFGLLQRGFVFWPLRKLIDWQNKKIPIPPYVSTITFDDGFAGVYHHAWPVLREFNLPATVFLNTAYLDRSGPMPFDDWGVAYKKKVPFTAYRSLTEQQCLEMAATGLVEFGSHTHSHEDFRNRPQALIRDLETSIQRLEKIFNTKDFPFAFPYGIPNLGFAAPDLVDAAKKCRVTCALNTGSHANGPELDPFGWGRFNVFPWDTAATLEAKLNGWYSWAPRLWQGLFRTHRPSSSLSGTDKTLRPPASSSPPVDSERFEGPKTLDDPCLYDAARASTREKDLISVIVPSYNRASWLKDAIESLTKQKRGDHFEVEIIIVDNASTDNTAEVVNRYTEDAGIPVRYLYHDVKGDAPARNHGIKQSKGKWIAFFDDDQLADANWLYELWCAAKTLDASIVGGKVVLDLPLEKQSTFGKNCRELLREVNYHSDFHPYTEHRLPGTCNAMVSREVFNRLGPFKEDMRDGGSDHDLFIRARRSGFPMWYTPFAMIHHRFKENRLTNQYFRWEALSGGIGQAKDFDHKYKGTWGLVLLGSARILQTMMLQVPLLTVHAVKKQKRDILDLKVRIWRTEGYARATLAIVFPKLFRQNAFFDTFDFRKGRTIGLLNPKQSMR